MTTTLTTESPSSAAPSRTAGLPAAAPASHHRAGAAAVHGRDALKQMHANLIARLVSLSVPRIPTDCDGQDILDIAHYDAALLELVRQHHGEVARYAGMSGAGNLDPSIQQADAMFSDIAVDFTGRMESAADAMDEAR